MSYALIRWAWSTSVNATEKLVLLALADCCNGHHDSNVCWPSMAHMQAVTGLSARTLQRAFNGLEAGGLISRTFGHGKETTTYTLHPVDPRQNDARTPVNMTPHPRQIDAPPPSMCRPSPVNQQF